MYDIIFLGGGPAGYEGAIAAGKKGLNAAVVESNKLGGTCLQWGCVPTKALLHSVKTLKQIKSSAKLGVRVNDFSVEVPAMVKYKDRVVSKLTKGIELLFKQNQVDLVPGRGKIAAPDTVSVDGERELKGKNIVIATGSRPAELPFLKFDGQYVIDSNAALTLESVPERLLVIGAGAIGVEMGAIYAHLGSQVTIVEILDQILPGLETEITEILHNELKKQKLHIHVATAASDPRLAGDRKGMTFTFKQGEKTWEESFPKVLLAVGRRPVTEDIFDASLGIKTDKRGFIRVDDNLHTGVGSIYACGDVVGEPLLAHKASHQAIGIVDYIREKRKIAHYPVPGAVFTFPELASIGLSEKEARDQGLDVRIGRFPYAAGSRSNAVDEKIGLVKIVADSDNTLLGAHIVGAEAAELMPLLNYAVSRRMKADDFKEMIFIHPTLSENVWEAVGEISGHSIHI